MPIMANMGYVQYVLTALIGGVLAVKGIGGVTIGTVVAFLTLSRTFSRPISMISQQINMVVNIVPWDNHASYDRMGVEVEYMDILGVKIPMNTIPITPGRNLAVILEVAAMNNRQRKMGYNAALEFTEQLNRQFEMNKD